LGPWPLNGRIRVDGMKIEFALENSVWPALLVDDTGTIKRANQAAVNLLGQAVGSDTTLLASVWAAENGITSEHYIARNERAPASLVTLHFQAKGGVEAYETHVCSWIRDGQRFLVFQLFKPKVPAVEASRSTLAEAQRPTSVDSGVAQKQKLDCALQMIRSVVLDFNNALTSILGHTSFLINKTESGHAWRSSLVEIEKSAERAAEVANGLAAFSRQDKDSRAVTAGNLNGLLRRTIELFQPNSKTLNWSAEYESRLASVNFDEAKMQQAFVKIFENAIQAVQPNGRITVRTRNLELAEAWRDGNAELAAGRYVYVDICDDGCGIPAEVLPRVFEPFFTTKSKHRGLGLAWVYGIVTNHGGSVVISSPAGRGTSVRIYLPALKRVIKDQAFKNDDLVGSQKILMVDDEDLMLTMGQMVLSEFGYQVLTANCAAKALEVFAAEGSSIDLVITDLVMPHMSGRELIERLRHQRPDLRIICCSGYVRPANQEDEDETYLQKPFTSLDLLRKVKEALS
jgi:two-component system, cell cycle sensor histidine kinase and response regulator CckA